MTPLRRWVWLPAAIPVVALGILGWSRRWTSEDAFIYFRVVDHVVHGDGPVFNGGERVEAYTSPLWTGALAAARALSGLSVEWIAVVAGLVLSVAGLAAASWGALRLARQRGDAGVVLPLGSLVFVATPPAWDFATSGLESGLVIGWLGASFLSLASAATSPAWRGRRLVFVAVLVGLGPVVRPDLAIVSVAFLIALLYAAERPLVWRGAALICAAVALPLAYEIFRMGYFASLVPNTALAKEAGRSYWGQGGRYVADFAKPYALWLPVPVLVALAILAAREDLRERRRPAAVVVIATVIAGVLGALYVARVGGDFMHGRMLLPPLFCLLAPTMAWNVRLRRGTTLAFVLLASWAVLCASALRAPYAGSSTLAPGQRITDERAYYVAQTGGNRHPVTLGDYAVQNGARTGTRFRLAARGDPHLIALEALPRWLYGPLPRTLPARTDLREGLVAPAGNVGLLGVAAGRHVWIVDVLGLADPVGARLDLLRRGRPGHEKVLPAPWIIARFGASGVARQDPAVTAARRVLRCTKGVPLRRLLDAIESPLGPRRFVSNLRVALTTYSLRVPPDAEQAARACSSTPGAARQPGA